MLNGQESRLDLEKLIIGCIIYSALSPDRTKSRLDEVPLKADDFSTTETRAVFEALLQIEARGGMPEPWVITPITAGMGIKTAGLVSEIVGQNMVSDRNLHIFVQTLQETIRAEKEEQLRQESARRLSAGEDHDAVAEDIKARSQALEERYGGGRANTTLEDAMGRLLDRAKTRTANGKAILTWVDFLDRMVVSLLPGEYGVIAAYPSVGKSALALQIALSRAGHGRKTGMICLEMDADSIAGRALASITGEDTRPLLRRPEALNDGARNGILAAGFEARQLARNILIEENPMITMDQITYRAKAFKRDGADLLLIDYFQLLDGEKAENRNLQLGALSRRLKGLARDLGIAIVVLSQFSNDAAKTKREPALHDLRDTGSLGQDADMVFILHLLRRDEATGVDTIKFKLEKGRNVGVGYTTLLFKRSLQTFAEASGYGQ